MFIAYAKNSSRYNSGRTPVDDEAKNSNRYRNGKIPIESNKNKTNCQINKYSSLVAMTMQNRSGYNNGRTAVLSFITHACCLFWFGAWKDNLGPKTTNRSTLLAENGNNSATRMGGFQSTMTEKTGTSIMDSIIS